MLQTQRFTLNAVPAHFGCGSIDQLPAVMASLGRDRAVLVTDQGVVDAGIAVAVERVLRDAGVATTRFDGVHSNPGTDNLDLGARTVRAWDPDGASREAPVLVALGGGSVLDAAKGLALMATNDGPARDFDYRNQPPRPGAPMVAVPTTAGTGSETNGFGVIDDPEAGRKIYVGHDSVVPRTVILDPDLTRGLPSRQTAATGMDVLAHALESLSSRQSNPYADGINMQVVGMVSRFLPRAVVDGQDLEARSQMLLAAHMAGLAFATTGLGLAHAVAHALSARIGAAHGVVLSVLLPHVLAFNLPARAETYARVAPALGVRGAEADGLGAAPAAVDAVRRLASDLGMPDSLRDLGLTEGLIPVVVEDALADEVVLNTPRRPTDDELRALLEGAL